MKTGLLAMLMVSLWSCQNFTTNEVLPLVNNTSTVNVTLTPCDEGIDLNLADLPQAIQDYLADQFPGVDIDDIEQFLVDNGVSFGVSLDNDVEILFDENGLVISMGTEYSQDDIPVADLPQLILDYLAENYPDLSVVHAEWDLEFGEQYYEVHLGDDLELYFDADGLFVCFDDSPGHHNNDDDTCGNGDDDDGHDDGYDNGDDDDHGNGDDDDDDDGEDHGDHDGGNLPAEVLASIDAYVGQNFPDYSVDEVDLEDWCDNVTVIEVELNGPGSDDTDLYFDLSGTYLWMATDIPAPALPTEVTATLETTYPGYSLVGDDTERIDYPDGTVGYRVKIVAPGLNGALEIVFNADGSISCTDH
ncbi:MAG: PepSY-like domain-containing protein [Lewinella sp.]|nr:PepSY-like domain-containing protein [Lewinella sp.]